MTIESHPIFRRSVKSPERFFFTSRNGSRVVTYQDSAVRWCYASDPSYNFMPLEPPLLHVDNAKLSDTGNLLLLYNTSEIRVIEIPWGYHSIPHQSFQKFSLTAAEQDPRIKQVIFHPLADQEHSIVVLRSDSTIALLNINYPETMQPHEHILNKYNGALGVDSLICDIESITFSLDGLILYALSVSEGGDIYAFYPCVPHLVSLQADELDLLLSKSLLQYDSLDVQTPSATKRNTVKQFKFVTQLRKKLEEQETTLTITPEWLRVKGQGPFTIAPFPDRYYNRTSKQIALLPIGPYNELLLMSLDDGTIAVLYRDLELTMCWDTNGYTYNNSFVLVESIKLDTGNILVLPHTHGQFYVLGEGKAYFIDTTCWSQTFSSCIDNSDLQPIADLTFKSKVDKIDIPGDIKSCAIWDAADQPLHVFVSDKTVYAKTMTQDTFDESKQKEDLQKPERAVYKPLFSQPLAEIMAYNTTLQAEARHPVAKLIEPPKRQKPFLNDSNEEQLDILTDVSKEFSQKVSIAQSLGIMLHGRFIEQQTELTRQLRFSNSLLERQQNLKKKSEMQSSECDAKSAKQAKLLARFAKLKENLIRIGESPKFKDMTINNKEMAWFREIRNQVLAFNQYVHQQKNIQDQLRYIKQELDHISEESDRGPKEPSDEWKELLTILENDTKIIKECNSELAQTFSEIGTEVSV
ncbi:related to Nucleoporin NUP82 [Zygosaccharomyces bailii]|nr:related to Nucleoporin NUP82 [Zygosaccharomyces bailii]